MKGKYVATGGSALALTYERVQTIPKAFGDSVYTGSQYSFGFTSSVVEIHSEVGKGTVNPVKTNYPLSKLPSYIWEQLND